MVIFIQLQPGVGQRAAVQPLGKQGGLAKPGRGRDQCDGLVENLIEPFQQARASDPPGELREGDGV